MVISGKSVHYYILASCTESEGAGRRLGVEGAPTRSRTPIMDCGTFYNLPELLNTGLGSGQVSINDNRVMPFHRTTLFAHHSPVACRSPSLRDQWLRPAAAVRNVLVIFSAERHGVSCPYQEWPTMTSR